MRWPKCLQVVAQGQVEKAGWGRCRGHVTADERAAWADGAKQV